MKLDYIAKNVLPALWNCNRRSSRYCCTQYTFLRHSLLCCSVLLLLLFLQPVVQSLFRLEYVRPVTTAGSLGGQLKCDYQSQSNQIKSVCCPGCVDYALDYSTIPPERQSSASIRWWKCPRTGVACRRSRNRTAWGYADATPRLRPRRYVPLRAYGVRVASAGVCGEDSNTFQVSTRQRTGTHAHISFRRTS